MISEWIRGMISQGTQGRAQFYSVIKKRREVSTRTERERSRVPGIIQYITITSYNYGKEIVCLQRSSCYKNPQDLSIFLYLSLSLSLSLFPVFVFLVGMHSFFIDRPGT
ncbi:hypothetical protein VN97_g7405 [Penicillium thymicola]|uniref:Uncharacterized protein n=1 Tax=Penicillium thymicola TaxID=293382 RepID=A0AAI9TFR1_PENTH|nr:hypothetical protein VN97_g7405 [Penicillium thymicola]